MNSPSTTFLLLVVSVFVWWFAIRAIAGDRFGIFHWIPVAMACFGVPILVADLTFQYPHLPHRLLLGWHGIGLFLAAVYLVRAQTSPSNRPSQRGGNWRNGLGGR